jgi:hypothetical protein
MSTGNPKDESNRRPTPVRATMPTTDPDSQLLARMRRTIAPEKAKRSPESSDAEAKPPSVHDQIYLQFQLERLDRCGFYRQPRRYGNVDPLDQLLGPDSEEIKDAEVRKPDKPRED